MFCFLVKHSGGKKTHKFSQVTIISGQYDNLISQNIKIVPTRLLIGLANLSTIYLIVALKVMLF